MNKSSTHTPHVAHLKSVRGTDMKFLKSSHISLLVLLFSVFSLSACGGGNDSSQTESTSNSSQAESITSNDQNETTDDSTQNETTDDSTQNETTDDSIQNETTDDSTQNETDDNYIGLISESELASLRPITLEEFLEAYEAVVANDPDLVNNEELLSRRIFDSVSVLGSRLARVNCGQNCTELDISELEAEADSARQNTVKKLWNKVKKLNPEQIKYMFGRPVATSRAALASAVAGVRAVNAFPCNQVTDSDGKYDLVQDSIADAFRHSLWNAVIAKFTDIDYAEKFTTLHEKGKESSPAGKMDLHNNNYGREVFLRNKNASIAELAEILSKTNFIFIEDMSNFTGQEDGLVYFSEKNLYSGELKGTTSNPDLGIVWDLSVNLYECDGDVRGNLVATKIFESNLIFQKRRFSGILDNDEHGMTLDISNPYDVSVPGFSQQEANSLACSGMKMYLRGDPNSLSGYWTSSSCIQGGEVSVLKVVPN